MREGQSVGLPEAFVEKMRRLLGEEYEAFARSYETERVQGLRFNMLKGDLWETEKICCRRFGLKPVPWCREGYYYDADSRPGRHPFHEAGVYYIQEPSAMAVVSLLDPQPGERILDLCAAPGGKTTHIAGRLCGEGLLISNEIHPARAKILSQNVERMGIRNAVVTNEDSGRMRSYFPEFFDGIVVDAPCSGEGMFRKDEQARAEWSEDNVRLCAARQQEILDHAAGMVKPGGRLVYSTCTFSPEEDEDGIGRFLERHPEFFVVKAPKDWLLCGLTKGRPEWSKGKNPQLSDTYRIWPHRAEGEGHYLALLGKTGGETDGKTDGERDRKKEETQPKKKRDTGRAYGNDLAGKKLLEAFLADTVSDVDAAENLMENLILFGDQVYSLPPGMPDFSGLRVLRPGLHLGTLKKHRLEPSHALALFLRRGQARRSVDLPADSAEISAYLSGSTLTAEGMEKGWVLVCTDGYSIGWAKAVSGTLKNHYPKGLRSGTAAGPTRSVPPL